MKSRIGSSFIIHHSSFSSSEPTMKDGKERREAKRISYICEVECGGSGVSRLATRINDLSLTGAFIDTVTNFSPGTILELRFHVKNIRIETTAEVRYCMPQMGMGVRFLDLKPEHAAALESLIEGKPLALPPSGQPSGVGHLESKQPKVDLLLGNFAVVSMFDVIQIIENNRLRGSLTVVSQAVNGEIHFNDGQIVGARSGLDTGVEALKAFLDVTEGSFEFNRSPDTYSVTIDAPSNMSLMLALLRVRDEEAALR
jgi:hypothetical protein